MGRLDDPFGRMQQKRKQEREALVKALTHNGVTTADQVREMRRKVRRRMLLALAAVVIAAILITLWPSQYTTVMQLATLLLGLWILITGLRTDQALFGYLAELENGSVTAHQRADSEQSTDQSTTSDSTTDRKQ